MDLIIKYLKEFKKASRADFKNLLFNKFPDVLTNEKKENKIKNLLQKMKVENKIKLGEGRQWFLDEI